MTAGALILLFVPEPKRGSADQPSSRMKTRTSWVCDMNALGKKYDTLLLSSLWKLEQEKIRQKNRARKRQPCDVTHYSRSVKVFISFRWCKRQREECMQFSVSIIY